MKNITELEVHMIQKTHKKKLYSLLSAHIHTYVSFLSPYLYLNVLNQLLQEEQEVLTAHRKVCK